MPPDVRKVYDLPEAPLIFWGYAAGVKKTIVSFEEIHHH